MAATGSTFSIHRSTDGETIEGNLKVLLANFVMALRNGSTASQPEIEPVDQAVDKRVRTAKIGSEHRAVLFQITGEKDRRHFVLAGIYRNEVAADKARRLQLRVNPINGVTELIEKPAADIIAPASTVVPPQQTVSTTDTPPLEAGSLAGVSPTEKQKADNTTDNAPDNVDATANDGDTTGGMAPGEPDTGVSSPPEEPTVPDNGATEKPHGSNRTNPAQFLRSREYTPQLLFNELGIDPETTDIVLGLEDESYLGAALSHRPGWEQEAITGMLLGYSFDQIAKDLGLDTSRKDTAAGTPEAVGNNAPATETEEDDRLIDGLKHPAVRGEFHFLTSDGGDDELKKELEKVLDALSFNKWLVYLPQAQSRPATSDFSGSSRISGGAGTGKTVVALHRANNLVNCTIGGKSSTGKSADNPGRVLLTTYTRSLADSLEEQMSLLAPDYRQAKKMNEPGLMIAGIDKTVAMVIQDATTEEVMAATKNVLGFSMTTRPGVLEDLAAANIWTEVIDLDSGELPGEVANKTFLTNEYQAVVLAQGINDLAGYRRATRTGRGIALNRKARTQVWNLIRAFNQTCASEAKVTFAARAAIAAEILITRNTTIFDHVVVDEAQDFHAGHWRFLRACVERGRNDIFLAEDAHQRIYGQRLVLSHFGIETRGRSQKLRVNYRTTAENLSYAVKILDNEQWLGSGDGDDVDDVKGLNSIRSGPRPVMEILPTETAEVDRAAEFIRQWKKDNPEATIGVLTRTRAIVSRVAAALQEQEINAVTQSLKKALDDADCLVTTMHSAKGLEFTNVILISVNKSMLPLRYKAKGLGADEAREFNRKERALLYVASSRARDKLVVLSSGESSELLPAPTAATGN
ncbi:3'-5' exonuclease [Corynebacterium mendelii]|uniref:DNA 3'-5' helicase n=1 Tax=Corynebacterium mendelii TaxID=2765362 RepID=A0A939E375_9CORY|nr:3'-5' exonuclease [Corynebacterium mendelii]MBN9644612.1 AAA family ATPase [Corynebacterium mendelii]